MVRRGIWALVVLGAWTVLTTFGTSVILRVARAEDESGTSVATEVNAVQIAATARNAGSSTAKRRPGGAAIGEWPQFRGPERDNRSTETGLLQSWPADGPPLLWTADGLGEGFSSVSVAEGRVLTMGSSGDKEVVICLDLRNGKQMWSIPISAAVRQNTGNGPRSTPTIDGDRVYAMGAGGDLVCLDVQTGDERWKMNILEEFDGRKITWGICESVLIDGGRLICSPGGVGAAVVALDKRTGNVIWKSQVPGNPRAGYASPIVADVRGVRQYVVFTSKGVVGIRAGDGRFLWRNAASANGTANCSTPLFHDHHVFSASGYGTGGALVALNSRGKRTTAKLIYDTKEMKNHHGGMVLLDGHVYGTNDPGIMTCLNFKTGEVAWKNRSVGKGAVTYADGRLYLRSENGPMALVEATPDAYRETGRFKQPRRSNRRAWAHPVVAAGNLFLRDQDLLLCYDVTAR